MNAATRKSLRSTTTASDPSLGNRCLDGTYTDDIGTLNYKLYLSSALRERRRCS